MAIKYYSEGFLESSDCGPIVLMGFIAQTLVDSRMLPASNIEPLMETRMVGMRIIV